jgi:hypothetical protein
MHIAQTVLLAHPAVEGLVLGMRMDVDQPRQHQPVLAVDHPVRVPAEISSGKGDHAVGKSDVNTPAIGVTPGRLVPGDDPIGIPDDRCRHGVP